MDPLPRKPVKAQPKQVKAASGTTRGGAAAAAARGRGARRGRNAGRARPKTAEELDAEMTDYFVGGAPGASAADGAATNGALVPAAGGDDMGVDEISVRRSCRSSRSTVRLIRAPVNHSRNATCRVYVTMKNPGACRSVPLRSGEYPN